MSHRIFSRCVLFLAAIVIAAAPLRAVAGGAITATDADDRTITFNAPGKTVVVLSCNEKTQWRTRDAGAALDSYQGNKNFRLIVLVDLRSTLAKVVKGYVKTRMRTDLDNEAVRLKPFYAANGNKGNPRDDVSVIPDWNGNICAALGWPEESANFRAVVYKDGKEVKRFDNLTEDGPLVAVVRNSLATRSTAPATPATAAAASQVAAAH